LLTTVGEKLVFWEFFIGLFVISLIFPFVFSLLITPAIGLLVVAVSAEERGGSAARIIVSPILAIVFAANVYILCGWSAYVASRALVYSSSPEVVNTWLYYVIGFFLCHGPLGFIAAKETEESTATFVHIMIAMIAYIVFCVRPFLIRWPYGWFLRWIYE